MSNKIYIKRSNVPDKVPTQLDLGELAANTSDGKLYLFSSKVNGIVQVGYDKISKTGDTMTGSLISPAFVVSGGTASQFLMADGSLSTGLTNTITGTGVINYIPKFDTSLSLIDSNIIDDGTFINLNSEIVTKGSTLSSPSTFGPELLTTGTSDGSWVGTDFISGYSHITGSTTTLTSSFIPTSGTSYYLMLTGSSVTSGTFSLSVGGVSISQANATGECLIDAINSNVLTITPTIDFNGKIAVSFRVVSVTTPLIASKNISNTIVSEYRAFGTSMFIGVNAGKSTNTNSTTSVGIGYNAMKGNTGGLGCTAIGSGSLSTGSGYRNTAVGRNTLANNISGGYSVAIGEGALINNTNGNTNTVVGQGGMSNNTIGGGNVALGLNAGHAYQNSNNCVFLGYAAEASANGTNNEIVIGNTTTGIGSNSVIIGNTSIVRTALRGNVLIGTTIDDGVNKLQVTGNQYLSGSLAIGTTGVTHPLTMSSTAAANGIAIYNTPDQTTNYERLRIYTLSNSYRFLSDRSGSGTTRDIIIGTQSYPSTFTVKDANGATGSVIVAKDISGGGSSQFGVIGILSASAGTFNNGIAISPTVNQSSIAGYRALFISPYEQTVGTGSKYLIDAGINSAGNLTGTHTSKFTVDNTGLGTFLGGLAVTGISSFNSIVYAPTLANIVSQSNATINLSTTGTLITRNIADANPALVVNQVNSGSTGDIFTGRYQGITKFEVDYQGNTIAQKFIKSGGTSTQFLKADGSVDNNIYLTATTDTYVTGGTYNNGTAIFTNTSGGTFNVTGFVSTAYWSAGTGANSVVTINSANLASGNFSLAEGYQTQSTSQASHAEGYRSYASGPYSHAEGSNTVASGWSAHAEGAGTIAGANYSHTEGSGTKTNGQYSHAEGLGSTANGQASHSEGSNTLAGGDNSHAGGSGSTASGQTSFVHGYNSLANNTNTVVFGANITGNTANTTYVDNFNIKTLGSGTSINNLGIDINGNIVTGSSFTGGTVTGSTIFTNGVTSTSFIKSGGTSNQFLMADGSVSTGLANQIIGSGTTGQVSFWDSPNSQSGSNNLFWDNTNNRLGIGTVAPIPSTLTIQGDATMDGGQLGSEVLTTGSGTNWTGTGYATGYIHTVGSTVSLTSDSNISASGTYYMSVTITGRTSGSININCDTISIATGITTTSKFSFRNFNAAPLIITPTTDFNGSIVVSVKLVNDSTSILTFKSSNGTSVNAIRVSTDVSNILYGAGAGAKLIDATKNILVGYRPSYYMSSGKSNISIGYQPNYYGVNVNYNVSIAEEALFYMYSGSSNIGIGYKSGELLSDGITPMRISNQSIFLGEGTKSLADSQTNQIVIGYNAIGNGSNTVTIGNSAITSTYLQGNVRATAFIKSGGTSNQFLKADGSVDNNSYLTTYTETDTLQSVTNRGNTTSQNITANSFIKSGGTPSQFMKADGSIDSNIYLTGYTEIDTLQTVTTRGAVTTQNITANSFIKQGGTSNQFLKADGSIDTHTYLTGYTETDTLQSVTDRGTITNHSITANSFIVSGGSNTQFLKGDGSLDLNTYAIDTNVVHLTGNETIDGVKTFTTPPISQTAPVNDVDLANKVYVDNAVAKGIVTVQDSGIFYFQQNQTTAGIFDMTVASTPDNLYQYTSPQINANTRTLLFTMGTLGDTALTLSSGRLTASMFMAVSTAGNATTYEMEIYKRTGAGDTLIATARVDSTSISVDTPINFVIANTSTVNFVVGDKLILMFYATSPQNKAVVTARWGGSLLGTSYDSHFGYPVVIDKYYIGLGNVQNVDQTNPSNIVQDDMHRFLTDYSQTILGDKTVSGNVTANSFIKSGGTSTQYLMADGSVSTLTNPVSGTGTIGQVTFWTGTNSQSGNSNLFWDNTNKYLGLWTSAPTHPITLSSSAATNGIALYGTVDQTTNYERLAIKIGSNYNITSQAGGTGISRDIVINSLSRFTRTPSNLGYLAIDGSGSANGLSVLGISGTYTNFSNNVYFSSIVPTINQTGTAGYRAFWISPYEQTVGSGIKFLIDAGTNSSSAGTGTHIPYFQVDNRGKTGIGAAATTSMVTIQGDSTMDSGQLGAEQMTTGAGSSWTGTGYATGYQHTTGDTSNLVSANNAVTGTFYYLQVTITGRTAGTITISQNAINLITNFYTSNSIGFKATGTAPIIVTPTTDFDGTITLSLKQVSASVAVQTTKSSNGTVINERRYNISTPGNLFDGVLNGKYNYNGNNNVAIGYNNLANTISGSQNVAVGVSCLPSSVSGGYNVAMGYNIFANFNPVSFATYNIGIGTNIASSAVFNGVENVFIGNSIASNATSAGSNLGIGYIALNNLTTGSANISLGQSSLSSITTANNNIAVGFSSLGGVISGSSNVALGTNSGRFIADGTTSLITPNQSLFIGENTKALADNQTNQIVIGFNATGNGSNTATLGNSSITSTYLQGNVGVAGSIPTHPLTISSTQAANGIAIYNTPDQTTNYERVRMYFGANTLNIATEAGGTGTFRNIQINATLAVNRGSSTTGLVNAFAGTSSPNASQFGVSGPNANNSAFVNSISVLSTMSQTGTGGYRGIWVSPFESGLTGSGNKYLIDLGTNSASAGTGTHTSKFVVTNVGKTAIGGQTAPTSMLDIQADPTMDGGQLGSEQMTTGAGSSWTGSGYATGYQHTTGDTSNLVSANNAVNGTLYYLQATITGRTAGSVNITQNAVSISTGLSGNTNTSFKATATAAIIVTPTTDFDGTITLSLKAVSSSNAIISLRNSTGAVVNEIRTTSDSTNFFMGLGVGSKYVSATQNTAIGSLALYSMATGGNNTAIGYTSMYNTTVGNANTSVGTSSMYSNISGLNNNAFGFQSLMNNTSGANNAAFGYQALKNNTTGGQNVGIGHLALTNNTISNSNIGIGYAALTSLNGGSQNVAVGDISMNGLTSGSTNTAVGASSLSGLNTGADNVGLGYQAGRYIADGVTPNTIANQSIFLGRLTKSSADNQTNQVVIGYGTTGNGSNTVTIGNSNITNNYFSGNINATKFVKSGGTAGQYLMADGSVSSGSTQFGDNASAPSASNVGTLRYRDDANGSYVDMVMKTSPTTYEWVNIIQNNF